MSGNYPVGVTDDDPYFDLPDAGEDESEPELCGRCSVPLNSTDHEAGFCTQCKEPTPDERAWFDWIDKLSSSGWFNGYGR